MSIAQVREDSPKYLQEIDERLSKLSESLESFEDYYEDGRTAIVDMLNSPSDLEFPNYAQVMEDIERAYGEQSRKMVDSLLHQGEAQKAKNYLESLNRQKQKHENSGWISVLR